MYINRAIRKNITIRKNANQLEFLNPKTNTYEKLKLIGFNENSDDSAHTFNNAWATLSNLDNPFASSFMNKVIGQDIGTNTAYNPLKMNSKRLYIPNTTNGIMEISNDGQEAIAASSSETYESNVLFFLPIKDLNITVTSIPDVNITYGNVLTNEQTGEYKAIVQQADGFLGNTGIVTAIATKVASYNVTSNPTLVTLSGGGLATPVTIPASKYLIRKRSIRSIGITDQGFGYKVNNVSHGLANYVGQIQNYYYSMFDGSNKDNSNTIEPKIFARIKHYSNIIPKSGAKPTINTSGYDYYSNTTHTWSVEERNPIYDAFILDGGEYMPSEEYVDNGVRLSFFDASNFSYNSYINGNAYNFNYDGWKGYTKEGAAVSRVQAKAYSEADIRENYEESLKYGIIPIYNFYFAFKAYNHGGYTNSIAEAARQASYYRTEFKMSVMRNLAKLAQVTGDDNVIIVLGNESNLDYMLNDFDYRVGSPTYNQSIFWADPQNPTNLQLNVEAMIKFYNDFAAEIKEKYGSKFIIGPGLQYAENGRCTQVETAFANNKLTNFDFLGNNYYGNQSTTTPYVNGAGLNVFTRYQANVPAAKRLPMLVLEAGSPSMIYGDTSGGSATVYTTEQGDIMKNMLKVVDLYDEVCGVYLFGFFNQPSRDFEYLLANYDGFRFPSTAVTNTHFNEKDMGVINFPLKHNLQYTGSFANVPKATDLSTIAKPALSAIRTEVAANYTNITKII